MAEQQVTPRAESRPRQWWRTIRVVIWAVVLTLLVVFVVQNYEDVEVDFIAWSFELQLAWFVLASGVLGFVLGWLRPRPHIRG
jgi:uncharacterized integral membrane protein